MKIFISQPMGGKTDEEILKEREHIIGAVKQEYGEDIEVLDTFFTDYDGKALQFLAKSLDVLSSADVAIFAHGWKDARGCRIEETCCVDYDIERIYL